MILETRVVRVERNFVRICSKHMATPDPADVLRAATCLQERAVLVTNDRHFNRIRDEGVIEVWSVAEAIPLFKRLARKVHGSD